MELKAKTVMVLSLLTLIASMFAISPVVRSGPTTYGPRANELYGRFIESPAAQRFALETGEVDLWFDIRDPPTVRDLGTALFNLEQVPEAFLYYHIDFNLRDQLNPGAVTPGATPWRTESAPGDYYTYSGAAYTNYVPLDDLALRHACAHLIPKAEIEAVVYQGITGAAIDSLVPKAQKAWHKTGVDGHPHSRAEAISILENNGYVFDPGADNPAPDPWGEAPAGNWIDPVTGEPMNLIIFAGVTQAIAPGSWGRDDLCAREFRAIGLPIRHDEVSFAYLTDTMMDFYQYDMYALGWGIGRFPDQLYSFFHSSNDFVPEGYNIPGVRNNTLDALCEVIEHNMDFLVVQQACWDAQDILAELCVSLPTVTRPFICASATTAAGRPDTLKGIVNSPGYGHDHTDTFNSLHWASAETPGNPLGIGGTVNYVVGSEPTNYHPGYASTTDEWSVVTNLWDGLIDIDPYTHDDIQWVATSWSVDPWDPPGPITEGMKMTFTLRDDVYWHDGVHYDANDAKWSLEFTRDQQIGRYFTVWQYMDHIDVDSTYQFSAYYNTTSLFILYDVAGTAALFPEHLYTGTDPSFRPEAEAHPTVAGLTKLIGTGPWVYRPDSVWGLGGFAHLTAYRETVNPEPGVWDDLTTHWWQSVEGLNDLLVNCWHWEGDVDSLGECDGFDAAYLSMAILTTPGHPDYDLKCDIAPEDDVPGGQYHVPDDVINVFDVYDFAVDAGKRGFYPA